MLAAKRSAARRFQRSPVSDRPSATGKRSLAGMAPWISGVRRLRERVELDLVEDPVPEQGERAADGSSVRARQVVGRTRVDGDVEWLFELA